MQPVVSDAPRANADGAATQMKRKPSPAGVSGCAWRETNVEDTDLEAVIQDLLEGQYSNPVRVIGFNLSEGWVRDVSEEVARRLRQHCANEGSELPGSLYQFVEEAAGT